MIYSLQNRIVKIYDDYETQEQTCLAFLHSITSEQAQSNLTTTIHRFPHASRLIIHAEKAQQYLDRLEEKKIQDMRLQDDEQLLHELKDRCILTQVIQPSHHLYSKYKERIHDYYSDQSYYLNLKTGCVSEVTRRNIKKYSQMTMVSNTTRRGTIGSFLIAGKEATVEDLKKLILSPSRDRLIQQYKQIKENMADKQLVNALNKRHPNLAWEITTIPK